MKQQIDTPYSDKGAGMQTIVLNEHERRLILLALAAVRIEATKYSRDTALNQFCDQECARLMDRLAPPTPPAIEPIATKDA